MISLAAPAALKLGSIAACADGRQIAVSSPAQPAAAEPPSEVPILSEPVSSDRSMAVIDGPEPVRSKINNNKGDVAIPLEINTDSSKRLPPVEVFVSLDVPRHSSNTVSFCAAYPYPQVLPRKLHDLPRLETKTFAIKNLILQTAYARKTIRTVAYPQGGWRWQEAYERALKRSGREEPHLLTNLYPFIGDMIPYCREECKRINEIEDRRIERYNAAVNDLNQTKADVETEATRKGMVPVAVRYTKFFPNGVRQGIVKLMPGHWWIIATHKVPGLTYYWQEPLAVQPGEPAEIVLNEDNALVIEGAW